MLTYLTSIIILILLAASPESNGCVPYNSSGTPLPQSDIDLLEFPLNLEYLEAEFFLWATLGYGLDRVAPNLTAGGPPLVGGKMANLDPLTHDVVLQFAYQEVGHLRAIKNTVQGFPRPQLDISSGNFAKIINSAMNRTLYPPFDPYANSVNYLIASYLVPYVGLTGYVGANPQLQTPQAKGLVAGLLGVESAQDAVIRAMLYQKALQIVPPYGVTVAEFTNRISDMRNRIGRQGYKDEGLIVPIALGAEGRTAGNIIAGDRDSVAYDRTPQEILRIVYGTANESAPGGFFPGGADGQIARSYII